MNFSISTEYVASGLLALAVAGWNMWLQSKLKAISILFEKSDALNDDLQKYKLHVAETCVNREQLQEMLAPLMADLQFIKNKLMNGAK